MKMANPGFRNLSLWLLMVCFLTPLFVLTGCSRYFTLRTFSDLEKKALANGTVAVGAARVMNYDNNDFKAFRKQLAKEINTLRTQLDADSNLNVVPQAYMQNLKIQYLTLAMNAYLTKQAKEVNVPSAPGMPEDPEKYLKKLSDTFYSIVDKTNGPQPSKIDLIGLRIATLKFMESEIEDVNNLDNVYPVDPNYRRVVISLDLTAWVSGKAKAALVYVDLYPYNADIWSQEVKGILLNDMQKSEDPNFYELNKTGKTEWSDKLTLLLEGFEPGCKDFNLPKIYEDPKKSNYLIECYRWLLKQKLLPRIIQVERMSPSEYYNLSQGDYSGTDLQLSSVLSANMSGSVRMGAAKKDESLAAKVQPLNLAFVAGERRAGWLFMPSYTEGGRMRPTERRLRMVVDIPKKMKKLVIHIHKSFLDSDLQIIPETDFGNQMQNLEQNLKEFAALDAHYEGYEKERVLNRLVTTRMWNLFYQSWSEEIPVDIPPVKISTSSEKSPPTPNWFDKLKNYLVGQTKKPG